MFDDEVTFVVVCFLRREKAERLVGSIRGQHPAARILMVDNSPAPLWPGGKCPGGAEVLRCADTGSLSAARNIGLSQVRTRYFALMDDDEVLIGDPVTTLWRALVNNKADIACGCALARKADGTFWEDNYSGHMAVESRVLRLRPFLNPQKAQFGDLGTNFFVARSAMVRRMGGWEERIPIVSEHIEFFLRAKLAGLRVWYEPSARVENIRGDEPAEYRQFRQRFEGRKTFMQIHNLRRFTNNIGTDFVMKGQRCTVKKRAVNNLHAVVVLSTGRTGSSCLSQVISRLGAFAGDNSLRAHREGICDDGYFEDGPLLDAWGKEDVDDAIDDAIHFLTTRSLRVVIKQPRLTWAKPNLLRRILSKRVARTTWVWSRRSIEESADSLHRTGWVNSTKRALEYTQDRHDRIAAFWDSLPHTAEKVTVWHGDLLANPFAQASMLSKALGWGESNICEAAATVRREGATA